MQKSKKLLSLALAMVMSLSLAVPAMAADETSEETAVEPYVVSEDVAGKTVILHSNDVHGAIEGYAKMAALKEQFAAAGASVIVVDAGDFSQGETSVSVSQGETAIELMNLAGYAAAAPGNHEFDYGYANLKALEEKADFPILCANILYEGAPAFDTSAVIEAGKVKIGFFGLDTPETATKAHPAKIQGVTFAGGEEMYAAAQEQVDALKAAGADVIICLGHLGIDDETAATANRSIDLLEKVAGIDVFIDGHSHSTLEDIEAETNAERKVGETVVTSTGTKFANIGVITIDAKGKITTDCVSSESVAVPEDSAIAERAAAIRAEIEADYGATFATSSVDLNGERAPGNRTEETNLGDLICDAMLWYATKDGGLDVPRENVIAITNGGGIRASISAGDVTKNDVNTVLPFGNTVANVYITGEALLEALEASTYCTPTAIGGFPQAAGIQFTVDTGKAFDKGGQYPGTTYFAPASINRVTIDSINGSPFDPAATYAVVTNDFVAAGGDTYYTFSTSPNIVDTGTPLDEALMLYIADVLGGNIGQEYAAPKGNITILDPLDSYADVDKTAWYADSARAVVGKSLMIGTDKGFEPDGTVTTATVFQTLWNLEGQPEPAAYVPTGSNLTDLSANTTRSLLSGNVEGAWYAGAVNWAASVGLYSGASFADGVIARSATAQILSDYCALKGLKAPAPAEGEDAKPASDAPDFNTVPADNAAAVTFCYDAGIMVGDENGALNPGGSLTRAEFAQILVNVDDFAAK